MKKYLIAIFLVVTSLGNSFGQRVTLEDVANHVGTGSQVTVCGKIYGGKYLESARNTPTLLDMGANYPNQLLTLVIFGENVNAFPKNPEAYFLNRDVCVTGEVIDYNGKPEIVLRRPDQIQLNTGVMANTNAPRKETAKVVPSSKPTELPKTSSTPKTAVSQKPSSTIIGTSVAKTSTNKTPQPVSSLTSKSTQDDITLTGDVYMRSGPSFDYPIVSTVKAGSVVGVLFSSNGWSQVIIKNSNGKDEAEGYIKNNVLK